MATEWRRHPVPESGAPSAVGCSGRRSLEEPTAVTQRAQSAYSARRADGFSWHDSRRACGSSKDEPSGKGTGFFPESVR